MIYEKRTNSYDCNDTIDGSCRDDFIAQHEIVVNITLHEYRELVAANSRLAEKAASLPSRIEQLQRDNDALRLKYDALVRQMAGGDE